MGDTVLDINNNIALSIRERIENATSEERFDMVEELHDKWVTNLDIVKERCGLLSSEIPTLFNYLDLALSNFGLQKHGLQLGSFERSKLIALEELSYLRLFFDYEELEDPDERSETILKFNKIFKSVIDAENAIRASLQLQNSMVESEIGQGEQIDIIKFTPMDTSNNTAYQNLLLYLLENLMRKGYRRYHGEIGKPADCYIRTYTEKGYDTHSWKLAMTLKQFIYNTVRKEIHYEMWQNLTNSKDNAGAAIKFLSDYQGGEFEEIKRDRHVFSYNNGVYITKRWIEDLKCSNGDIGGYVDEWIPYEGPKSKKIGASVIASKYFELDFDEETIFKKDEPNHLFNDWWEIILEHTPSFKSIMDFQEWSDDVQKWLCILMGRCLYDLGELDDWQVIAYLLGLAGTGKSTLLVKVLKLFYEACDVGTISNNMEKKFGLGAISDKKLNIGPEIKSNFSMEQSEFQSIISGEDVQIAVKNQTATSKVWNIPAFLAGNEVPQFSDNAGSISRRLLVFMFSKRVKKGDTQLGKKLEKELGHILHACNRAYLDAVNTFGSSDVWNVIPQEFKDTRDEMAETTNQLVHFLKSERVILGPDLYTRERTFVESFNDHCKETNLGKARWTPQYCMGPFETFGIKIKKNARKRYPNIPGARKYLGNFIMGVDIKVDHQQQEEKDFSDPEDD
jgi:hypothetical protein